MQRGRCKGISDEHASCCPHPERFRHRGFNVGWEANHLATNHAGRCCRHLPMRCTTGPTLSSSTHQNCYRAFDTSISKLCMMMTIQNCAFLVADHIDITGRVPTSCRVATPWARGCAAPLRPSNTWPHTPYQPPACCGKTERRAAYGLCQSAFCTAAWYPRLYHVGIFSGVLLYICNTNALELP